MSTDSALRFDVPTRELLNRFATQPLPLGLRASGPHSTFHRDIYLDTPDAVLQRRGVTCRFRVTMEDRRILTVTMRMGVGDGSLVEWRRYEAEVPELEAADALLGVSKPARRLRAVLDPRQLGVRVELQTERRTRAVRLGLIPIERLEIHYDSITVRSGTLAPTFYELVVRKMLTGGPSLDELRRAFRERDGLHPVLVPRFERAEGLLGARERAPTEETPGRVGETALVVFAAGRLALQGAGDALRFPTVDGSGEEACRRLADGLGLALADARRAGTVAVAPGRVPTEIWLGRGAADARADGAQWLPVTEVFARAGHPGLRDATTLGVLAFLASSETFADLRTVEAPAAPSALAAPPLSLPGDAPAAAADEYLNAELSWLEFNGRLLELAEDPATPLLAQLRFLSIFSSNLDEFFMVRVGGLRQALAEDRDERGDDGMGVTQQLDAIAVRVRELVRRQRACLERVCRPALAAHDIRVLRWEELPLPDRAHLRRHFEEQVFPLLTPHAITRAPGHPFPHIANLRLALGIMVRDAQSGRLRFGSLTLPDALPRFVRLPDRPHFVPLEDVVRAHLHEFYPHGTVEAAHCFRVTRAGDLSVDEEAADDLLVAVEEEIKRRPFAGVVRLELERAMPDALRELLRRELRMVGAGRASSPGAEAIYEVDGLLDLGALREIADLEAAELDYAPFRPAVPVPADRSIFAVLRERDVLVHHPYDAFDHSVLRLFSEAADDPDVLGIKLTLYRAGARSPVVDALMRAARLGKEVDVFVELKARFDEARNIDWVRKLEQAGVHVVYGYVRLKTHAKVALVVRREGGAVRRYVHVGTGNYNAATARLYTDLGLLSADDALGAELNDLFNELTGSSEPPRKPGDRLVVAPNFMLGRFHELIEREAEHARAGRGGRLRVKVNGLADRKLVRALYHASQAGVEVELLVRGICTLRPGVPGLSERIRVVCVMGRFLEHARIVHFRNAGADEYYIGSADWRPRNLRRRVEVAARVSDPAACARLDRVLETELADPTGWALGADGLYRRRGPGGAGAQEALLGATSAPLEGVVTR